ncbi:MAG: hypothetical protein B7Y25_01245 [Alphaproteobacteria bacterium 16-39-46]|nr:MAG: hypothetical protein B7Y25_01245 [Alphaproteobacteria bacterium 16-39-46]OZA44133.1 MAG: hypothetical protein B7X84_01235 [Alphaproteobacteria bacterium 17-39-52]
MHPLLLHHNQPFSFLHTLNFNRLRKRMVENQLYPHNVTDERVLEAFRSIPREKFLPDALHPVAYSDALLQVFPERYMIPPFMLGRLIQALNPQNSDATLVIGDVTGYTSALLSGLSGGVVSLIPETLSESHVEAIKEVLNTYSPNPVILKQGSLEKGAPLYAPYTHLFFDGSVPYFPKNLLEALMTKGSAIAMLWKTSHLAKATLYKKTDTTSSEQILFEGFLPLLSEFKQKHSFSF